MRLEGKKVIVTGANRSIGKAIALLFAKEGAELVISYRSDKKGAKQVLDCIQKAGGSASSLYADFSTHQAVEQFYRECIHALGHVDILVNNAGGYNTKGFFELTPQDFEQLLQVTLMTPFFLSQLVAKGMVQKQTQGNIINISSISGTRPTINRVAHASGKAALNMLTQTMALELAQYGIRVNAIAPGYTPYENSSEFDSAIKDIPLGRAGLPSDLASTALFLATEESSWMTGQILTVDGGHSIALSITKGS